MRHWIYFRFVTAVVKACLHKQPSAHPMLLVVGGGDSREAPYWGYPLPWATALAQPILQSSPNFLSSSQTLSAHFLRDESRVEGIKGSLWVSLEQPQGAMDMVFSFSCLALTHRGDPEG